MHHVPSKLGMQGMLETSLVKLETDGYICFGLACISGLLHPGLAPAVDVQGRVEAVRQRPPKCSAGNADAEILLYMAVCALHACNTAQGCCW